MIKFRQAIYRNGKFQSFHYWGFIDGKFVQPDFILGGSVEEAHKNSDASTGLIIGADRHEVWENDFVALGPTVCRVKLADGCFYADNEPLYKILWHGGMLAGNIHENPELISELK